MNVDLKSAKNKPNNLHIILNSLQYCSFELLELFTALSKITD